MAAVAADNDYVATLVLGQLMDFLTRLAIHKMAFAFVEQRES